MTIKMGLLALLDEQPQYGYQLKAEFEARTGSTWPLNVGQVYTTLTRLERDGLVEAEQGADAGTTTYRITRVGQHEVRDWFATPVTRESRPRDELAIKLALAVTSPGVDVRAVVQAQRTDTVRALQEYTRLKARATETDLAWLLVLDSMVFQAEAEVRWLDHCETRLVRAARPPENRASRHPRVRRRPAVNPVLELREVSRLHGDGEAAVHALRGVSLPVQPGELVAVMGPSGSGKSTLLTIAGGLDSPTAGQVLVEGQELTPLSAKARAALRRRSIGYVFQDLNLVPALTAAENVALPRELDGVCGRQAQREAMAVLEEVGVAELAQRFPDEMSGGQQQRVAIARALIGERRLVLADEPTGALDSVTGEAVLRLLRTRCDAGAAGVLVTHEARHAGWADRVVFLRDGVVVDETGPAPQPEQLLGTRW